MTNLGTHAKSLDGKERLRILHEYFNQDTMEPFRFSFKELAESGKSVKDYIAPPGFDFRYPSRFKAGKMYGSVHYLDIIAPKFDDELLKKLLDIDTNLTVTMHMQTMDPVKAIKMLKGALTNIQKMKIEEQKKAVRSGYDMDILPTDIITYEKDTLDLLDDLNSSNQKMVKMTFLITCYGRNKRELENITQRVSGIIQQANCNLRCMQYLQEQGLMASAPIGCNDTGIERDLTTKSTAILVPFCTQELFMPAPAIYYGLNALSNNMIMADRKRLRTPNGVILGTPGSGKSFSAKREILSCFLMTKDDIVVCDPEGEYFALVGALHGQVAVSYTHLRLLFPNRADFETVVLFLGSNRPSVNGIHQKVFDNGEVPHISPVFRVFLFPFEMCIRDSPLMQCRNHGNEYIGVMLDGVQIKVVLIVVMGAFVLSLIHI